MFKDRKALQQIIEDPSFIIGPSAAIHAALSQFSQFSHKDSQKNRNYGSLIKTLRCFLSFFPTSKYTTNFFFHFTILPLLVMYLSIPMLIVFFWGGTKTLYNAKHLEIHVLHSFSQDDIEQSTKETDIQDKEIASCSEESCESINIELEGSLFDPIIFELKLVISSLCNQIYGFSVLIYPTNFLFIYLIN